MFLSCSFYKQKLVAADADVNICADTDKLKYCKPVLAFTIIIFEPFLHKSMAFILKGKVITSGSQISPFSAQPSLICP